MSAGDAERLSPESAENQRPRLVRFPARKSLGWLYTVDESRLPAVDLDRHAEPLPIRQLAPAAWWPWRSPWGADEGEVTYLSEARGTVEVPPGKALHLDCHEPTGQPGASIFPHLARLGAHDLQSLDAWDAGHTTGTSLVPLARLTGLHQLSLTGGGVDDAGLAQLSGLVRLEKLRAFGPLAEAGLDHLRALAELRHLEFGPRGSAGDGLAFLQELRQLVVLRPGYATDDAGLAYLRGLTALRVLDLTGTQITDAGLAQLSGLTRLRALGLADTAVTDAGLAQLQGLPAMQALDLRNTSITDAGLADLSSLPTLRVLRIHDTRVSQSGLARFKDARPDCRIWSVAAIH